MPKAYSYDSPSAEHLEMVKMYEQMHSGGSSASGQSAKKTFPGKMLLEHAPAIRDVIQKIGGGG